jgi:hypothetical protein
MNTHVVCKLLHHKAAATHPVIEADIPANHNKKAASAAAVTHKSGLPMGGW